MKYSSTQELEKALNEQARAYDIQRDDKGNLLSFKYDKRYSRNSHKEVVCSLKKGVKPRRMYTYLAEEEFFALLFDNADKVIDIKIKAGKVYKFKLDGKGYETDKPEQKGLFDYLDYKDFLKVTRSRFYGKDTLLRRGYYSGLIGSNSLNIYNYEANYNDYDVYDVDFNAAYPYCFRLPLPTGKFYTREEYEQLDKGNDIFAKFYKIKIKTIPNPFGVLITPPPKREYVDFDFLISRDYDSMIVSEHRLNLIRIIYGNNIYIIRETYYVKLKCYGKLMHFAMNMYDLIQKSKELDLYVEIEGQKIALNSLIGQFGRRDSKRVCVALKVIDSGGGFETLQMQYDKVEQESNNYLPIAMYINDFTAWRLFNLLTNDNVLRLSWNTDGAIIGVRKGTRVINSHEMGKLKSKKINAPMFLETPSLYARPLVVDTLTMECYNTHSIYYDNERDEFRAIEKQKLNTRNGFITYINDYVVGVDDWQGFNVRYSEIMLKLNKSALYKKVVNDRDTYMPLYIDDIQKLLNNY